MEQFYSKKAYVSDYCLPDIKKEVEEDAQLLIALGYEDLKNNSYLVCYGKQLSTLGTCQLVSHNKITGAKKYKISININFLKIAPSDAVHNTIMHECIHSIEGCLNHGKKWKEAAAKVNKAYCFTKISRVANEDETGEYSRFMDSRRPYIIKCSNCGRIWRYARRSTIYNQCAVGARVCLCGNRKFLCYKEAKNG